MKVLRRTLIHPDAPQKLSIRLSLTDVFVRNVQVCGILLYERPLQADVLERGLAHVLSDFAPYAARMRRRGIDYFIETGNTGVRFSVCRSDLTMPQVIARLHERERLGLVDVLEPRKSWSGAPVLSFQITHFADGTSALGYSWHHATGDFRSLLNLFQAWSNQVAGLPYEKPIIVEDREAYLESVLPQTGGPANLHYMGALELTKLVAYIVTQGLSRRRLTLSFEQDELANMRDALQAECGQRLSTNDALNAHMCTLISACDSVPRNRKLSVAVSVRKHVGIRENVLGNMVSTVEVHHDRSKPASALAVALRHAITNLSDNHRENRRLVAKHGGLAKIARFMGDAIDPYAGSLLVTSVPGFGLYALDFGVKGPTHFHSVGDIPLPWLGVIHEGYHGRGLIYEIELPRRVAERLLDANSQRQLRRYRGAAATTSAGPALPARRGGRYAPGV